MIEDREGRTTLHYAVDTNMFKFFSLPLSFYCSIEDRRKVEEQWMKKHKNEILSNANLNARQDQNQNLRPNSFVGTRACVLMLLQVGVELSQEDKKGNIPDAGTCSDEDFQRWWYDIVDKVILEKKQSFNEAGNALSAVGTLTPKGPQ
jgi:hypothetical protein